ncbi:MAG: type II secretion system protein GspN [Bdellovibrionaceae bacterium]|jgi:type II secretion system protein N|nr:type II secretion system protein GspN [Pseudobdellovibrionaceae bacterium]
MIGQIISNTLKFIKTNFKNFLLFILSTVVLIALLFPYDDLSDFISAQVAKATGNKFFVQMEGIGIGLLPGPAIQLNNFSIESSSFPRLTSDDLSIAPNFLTLLMGKAGGTISASNLYQSDLELNFTQGDSVETKSEDFKLKYMLDGELNIEGLSLNKLKEATSLPIDIDGKLSVNINFNIDPNFTIQPNGEFQITSSKVSIPSPTIPIPNFAITLPNLNFSYLKAKGRIVDSEIIIEEALIGDSKDPMYIKLKGKIGLKLKQSRLGIKPIFSSYEAKVLFNIHKDLRPQLIFMTFIDGYKAGPKQADRENFQVKLTGSSFRNPPRARALSTF